MPNLSRWVCPHCEHASMIAAGTNITTGNVACVLDSAEGYMVTQVEYIACPNPACKRLTATIWYGRGYVQQGYIDWRGSPKARRLAPEKYARPIPAYVPEPIREDYEEACAIADLSPKAAATLARRALQGIVRDFHGIVRGTLNQELDALRGTIDPVVWQAIDVVRGVGNIGAHMEKDISVIVDVEPHEAVRLLRLIELLINEWYVARHRRQEELQAIITIGEEKQKARKVGRANDAEKPSPDTGSAVSTNDVTLNGQ